MLHENKITDNTIIRTRALSKGRNQVERTIQRRLHVARLHLIEADENGDSLFGVYPNNLLAS